MQKDLMTRCNSLMKQYNNKIYYKDLMMELNKNHHFRSALQLSNAINYLEEQGCVIDYDKATDATNTSVSSTNKKSINDKIEELNIEEENDLLEEELENELDEEFDNLEEKYEIKEDEFYTEDETTTYFNTISKIPLLTAEEEYKLLREYNKTHNPELREKLINSNLRLVVHIAKKYNKMTGLTIMDLIQYGNIGLMTAIEKYDVNTKYKLSTYATYWIRQAILRGIANDNRIIRMPVHIYEQAAKNKKSKEELAHILNRQPSDTEIIDYINTNKLYCHKMSKMDMYTYKLLESHYNGCISSLDATISNENDSPFDAASEFGQFIESDLPSPEEIVVSKDLKHILIQILEDNLKKNDVIILKLRFGLEDNRCRTLREVANILNVTPENIRQREGRALHKLRVLPTVRRKLADYIEIKYKSYLSSNIY